MLEKIRKNWIKIKEVIRDEMSLTAVSFDTWLAPLEIQDVIDHKVLIAYLDSPSEFSLNYLNKKFNIPIKSTIEELVGEPVSIEFIFPENQEAVLPSVQKEEKEPIRTSEIKNFSGQYIDPSHTFDTFVVGHSNEFAHAACISVATNPGTYNPLFIYGGSGLGKTHLMQAIANFILNHDQNKRILYTTAEVFNNEIIEAVASKSGANVDRTSFFRKKYRDIDVLLIDDIQFIFDKPSSLNEFFNTFNTLYNEGKQIIITSDKAPRDFENLEERILSRFESGLTVDITLPDYETRMAILRKEEEFKGYTVDNEILKYIALNIKGNIRSMKGALQKVYSFSKLQPNTPLNLDIVKENLKYLINPDEEKKITPEIIIKIVADHFAIKPSDITSKKQSKEVAYPRQIAIYLIRTLDDITQEELGKSIGNKNHSTISYCYTKIAKQLGRDENLKNTIEILKKKIMQ